MVPNEADDLLDQTNVATSMFHDKVAEATLEKWRCTGEGPPFIKVGRKVFYRRSAVEAWLTSRTISHTQEKPTKKRRR